MEKIQVEILDKHRNYLQYYKPNDIYWGLGIEHETYLEFSKLLNVNPNIFYTENIKSERYSVDYYKSYKPDVYQNNIKLLLKDNKNNKISYLDKDGITKYKDRSFAVVPLLLNSHSFSKTDANNQPITTYSKNPKPNPDFNGKTLYEFICEKDSYFKDQYMKTFIFDGDTIEFINLNFYKKTIQDVIDELEKNKKEFTTRLQRVFEDHYIYNQFGTIKLCKTNYPFVSFMTNFNKCSIFNNMTYHFNFTLPTKLNNKCYIENYPLFIMQHKNLINLIHWVEPLLIATYGSGDILAKVNPKLSGTSQRIAKSRYIGFGTYDVEKMTPGKLMHIESNNNHLSDLDYWWFNQYYKNSDYTKEDLIGLDINFHKHKNHGIELRIFDYFNESKLEDAFKFIILLMDHSLTKKIKSPVRNKLWNDYVVDILNNRNAKVDDQLLIFYKTIFDFKKDVKTTFELYNKIQHKLLKKYKNIGFCYKNMICEIPQPSYCNIV
jgi:hypothetical protein